MNAIKKGPLKDLELNNVVRKKPEEMTLQFGPKHEKGTIKQKAEGGCVRWREQHV